VALAGADLNGVGWRWLDQLACWGSPLGWQRFHAVMALGWVVNIPIAVSTGLKASVPYLIVVSLLTAFSGEMSALHGVTVQKNQEEEPDGVEPDS
jgi:hypothetical protein